MIINPFADIYNEHKELSLSLSKKIRDTFLVFFGDFYGSTRSRWGLCDYFTLGINQVILNLMASILEMLSNISLIIFIPFEILAFVIFLIDILLRLIVSSILTIISIPLVVLVHVISNELKQGDIKKEVDAIIQACLEQGSSSLTIDDISINPSEWTEIRTNYLIDQLNHYSEITKLIVNYSYADTAWLLQFGLKLKHVTNLSIPKMGSIKVHPKYLLAPSEEEIEEIFVAPSKNLSKFLMENTTIDELDIYDIKLTNRYTGQFSQLMDKEIKHLCKVSFKNPYCEDQSKYINNYLEASVLLKSWFEFFKIMVTPWSAVRDGCGQINQDIIKIILMTLLQRCSKDISQKSTQELIKSGFFSKQAVLIDFDSQQEEKLLNRAWII